jgi:GntR family transcriptional regulator, vanillate catabolism transcriptional regulator
VDVSDNDPSAVATSSEQVLTLLREHILSGRIAPGERLHQDRLAEMLGVSRTPLRTALTTLAQTGLVRYEPNRGFRAREFSILEMMEAFRIRAELESMACRLAAVQITEESILGLQQLVEMGDQLLAGGNLLPDALPPYRQMNVDFHTLIMDSAGNRWIRSFVEQLHSVPLASDRIFIWDDHAMIARSHDDHHRIVEAFRQRDGRRAGGLMFEHISFAGQLLLEKLRSAPDQFLRVPLVSEAESSPPENSRNQRKSA